MSGDGERAPRHDEHPHDHADRHDELSHVSAGAEPAIFAARADVVFAPPAAAAAMGAAVRAFLHRLRDDLAEAGCVLIGHVKGTLVSAERGGLTFSLTTLDGEARLATSLCGDLDAAVLTLNVIVFGVPERTLPGLAKHAWEAASPALTTWRV